MCLKIVERHYTKTSMKLHLGYKVFRINEEGGLSFPYFHWQFDKSAGAGRDPNNFVPQETWMKAQSEFRKGEAPKYWTGFHIFLNVNDAIHWASIHLYYGNFKIFRVLFRNVTAKGRDEFSGNPPIVVAQEMLVTKEEVR